MSIANNELWVRRSNNLQAAFKTTSGFTQTLVSTELKSDGWTVFTFDAPLTKIGDNAFYGSNLGVSEVIMPETVTEIGDNAFLYQYSLKSINFPDALTTIGTYALYMGTTGNNKLTEIILGPNLTYIGYQAFYGLNALTKIKCHAIVAPELYRNGAFKVASGGTLYYPEGADYSTWLQNVDGFLGYYGWSGETFNADFDPTPNQILRIKVNNNVLPDIMESTLTDNTLIGDPAISDDGWIEYYFAEELTNIPMSFFYNQTNVIDFELPESCIAIGNSAFENTGLIDVTIPDWVTSIGTATFANCTSLTSFKLGNGVKELLNATFENCLSLASIDLGKVEKIHNSVFNRAAIEELVLPATLKQMGTYLFNGCKNLKTITSYATTAPAIDKTTFFFVPEFGTLNYPEGSDYSTWLSTDQYYLGYYIWNYTPPEEPDVPEPPVDPDEPDVPEPPVDPDEPGGGEDDDDTESGIPNNELWVEGYYGGLCYVDFTYSGGFIQKLVSRRIVDDWTVFTFDAPLTRIGDRAFRLQDIKKVILPDTVTEIQSAAFQYCEYLSQINIGNNVTTIGAGAFDKCLFEELELGSGLKEIGVLAFANLKYIKKITCKATVAPAIKSDTFYHIKLHGTLYYPEGSDYSQWLSDEYAYLGDSYWTGQYIDDTPPEEPEEPDVPVEPDEPDEPAIPEVGPNGVPSSQIWVKNISTNLNLSSCPYDLVNYIKIDDEWRAFVFDAPITNIWYNAFNGAKMEEVILPDSVTEIEAYAFARAKINKLTLGSSTIKLKDGAFQYGQLQELHVNGQLKNMGSGTFSLCTGHLYIHEQPTYSFSNGAFSALTFSDKVTYIPDYFFENLPVEVINYSNSITKIGDYAFRNCDMLKEIIIPDSVLDLGEYAFYGCDRVENIYVGKGIKIIKKSSLYNVGLKSDIKELAISDNVEIIEEGALNLWNCYKVVFGRGLREIGEHVFGLIRGLQAIYIYASTPPIIQKRTFSDLVHSEYGTLYYPEGADYSQWLSDEFAYLGYWHWNGAELAGPTFLLEYKEINAPKIGMVTTIGYTIADVEEIVVDCPWWVIPTQRDGYFELDILENDHFDRAAEIIFTAFGKNEGDIVIRRLIIRQEGIEDMAASIALYKTRMNFPAEGGSQYVQVDYINTSAIYTPTCTQSWVTIEQTQAGTAVDGSNTIYQRQYKITMAPTSFARQTNITFSCLTDYGNTLSNNKLILYQAEPTINPDDGEGETHVSAFSVVAKVKIDGTPEYSSGNNLGVGYENLIPKSPIVDVDWIHVDTGVEDTSPNSYDIVMRYPTTYDANTGAERTGTITWNGVDVNGIVYTATTEVTQFGTDTPVDEGMIELQSLSVTLPASGGSDTFVVKYYDAKTIYDPEFEGDWATITEISSTSADGVAWNGTECIVVTKTYRVTAQATNSGRIARVILRADINYYDGGVIKMEKDKFRVNQIAPGETEFHGVIYPFRQELTYDHKGYSTSWGSVRVGYKDMPTINPPKLNADWLSVKEIKDVTYSSKEYDKIYEYTFTLEENVSSVARTAIVTFNGYNELNGYVAGEVKIVQASYDSEIDVIATNYKGYFTSMEGKLYSVAFVTDPDYDSYGEITLAGESPVVVSYADSERLYEPLRTSTCTVRVVSTQYLMNLYTGKAQGTQVILKNEDDDRIEWCGFLQPNLYNQGYSSEIEEIEFEASDCLSTLQYLKYEDYYSNGRMSVPFSYAIGDIMEKCKLIKSYYITKKQYNDNISTKDLKLNNFFIAEHNFFSEEDEPWTLEEVLEETCKFFGYVCYQWGDCVYFIDYDQFTDAKKLLGYRYDKDSNWSKSTYVNITAASNQITADSYRDTGADMSLDDVFNKVTVNCNYYNKEEVIPDMFDDKFLTNRIDGDGFYKIRRFGGRGNSILMNETYYRFYDHKNIDSIYYAPIVGSSNHETKATPTDEQKKKRDIIEDFVGANIIDMIHLSYNEANGKPGETKDWERYLLISQLNRPWCGAEGTFHWENYNFPIMEFKNLPTIYLDNRQDESTGRSTSSSRPNTRPGTKTKAKNYFVIDAEAAFTAILNNSFLNEDDPKGMDYKRNIGCYIYQGTYTYDHIRIDAVKDKKDLTYPALTFYLEIPKKGWWNGSGWVDYKTHFEVPLEALCWEDDFWNTSKNVKNTVESNLFIGKAGYKIPLPAEMDSTEFMYFAIGMPRRFVHLADIEGGDNTGEAGNAYCFIKDLKLSICNLYSELYGDKDMIYENIIDQDNVIEGDEIDLKITSDPGYIYSLSTVSVMANDYAETEFYFMGLENELLKPEEAIIEKYVNQYSTPSIKENVTVDMSFTPHQLITDTYWEKDFVMIGQEIDYKADKQTITLLQKK